MYLGSLFVQKIHYKSSLGVSYGQVRDLFLREYILLCHMKDAAFTSKCGREGNKLYTYLFVQAFKQHRILLC